MHIDVIGGAPVISPRRHPACVAGLVARKAACRRCSSPGARYAAFAVEHGGDAVLDHDGDGLARVLAADGALEAAELDVTAPVEAAGADLAAERRGDVDVLRRQEREVQLARVTGTGGASRCGYYESASGLGILSHTRYHYR